MSEAFPASLQQFTKMTSLLLNDNCFTGTLPESWPKQLTNLQQLNVANNFDLSGSLNGVCKQNDSSSYREGLVAVAADCATPLPSDGSDAFAVECDCCICCDHNDYQCNDPHSGNSWKSYLLNIKAHGLDDKVMDFFKKHCRTEENKIFITNECPCLINTNGSLPSLLECTDDCSTEGAMDTYCNVFWW